MKTPKSLRPTGTRAASSSTVPILAVILLPVVLGLLLTACTQGGGNLPAPSSKIAYIRSALERDNGLYAVDVDRDEVIGEPLMVGRADYAMDDSMAMAPNGKLYLLRGLIGSGRRPFAEQGLLILDPNRGWQRTEPPMSDDGEAVAISSDGRAFIARRTLQPDLTLKLDVYDTSSNQLIGSDAMVGLVDGMLAGNDGLVYISHWSNYVSYTMSTSDDRRLIPPGIKVIRSSDLRVLCDVPLNGYAICDLELGPDGLLYGTVSRRQAAGQAGLAGGAGFQRSGLLVAIDPGEQRVVAELEVPDGAYGLAITPEGKAYILHRDPSRGGQPSKVSVYDLRQRKLLKELPVGRHGTFIKRVGPTKVYAATRGIDEEKGSIWVIDTESDTVIKSFRVGDRPEAIVMPW